MPRITRRRRLSTTLTGAAAFTLLCGTAAATTVPTFQEFAATTYQDTDGQFIVNGDEPEASTGHLRQFYDRMVDSRTTSPDSLIVNQVNGRDDRWSAAQAQNLTYCVSTKFGADYNAVVDAVDAGAALWEGASSGVNFTHVSSADSSCSVRNRQVVFSVEPTKTTQYIARAFFPSSSDRQQNILVNARSLQNAGSWSPSNILAHELGHVLGFRHEHTRPEAGTCFEDNNWRPLTNYDSASIMHYPQCNGTSTDLSFTTRDGEGVRALYGN